MGEYLPDGTYQRYYSAICRQCSREIATNLYGQGNCPHCGNQQNPMRDDPPAEVFEDE